MVANAAAVLNLRLVAGCIAWLAIAHSAAAQQPLGGVNGYVTLASGYWEHGLSQSRDSSLEVGIDYQHPSGFFVGARAVTVEFALEFSYDQSPRRR